MFYKYGLTLGARLGLHGHWKQSLKFLIRPVNYWRKVEYDFVFHQAQFGPTDKILDIGSPKLLSLYLAEKIKADLVVTDIDSYFIGNYTRIMNILRLNPARYNLKVEDGRKLSFKDNSFSKVYSISVIEHIPDDGDTQCLKEIRRVLAHGGKCLITVPFSVESRNEFKKSDFYWIKSYRPQQDGKVFYQRRYNEEDLYQRLINPSGLKLKKLSFIGEKILVGSNKELSDFLPAISGPLHPLMTSMFLTPASDSWKKLKKPLCAMMVLEK